MDAVLRTPAQVIEALGGSRSAATKLGLKLPRVSMWLLRDRIPSEHFLSVNKALEAEGKQAAPQVFGMAVPSNGEAA